MVRLALISAWVWERKAEAVAPPARQSYPPKGDNS